MKLEIEQIDDYIKHCEIHKRLSNHSLKAYKIDLYQFYGSMENKVIDKGILLKYIDTLHETYKPKSVKRKIATLSAFFSYLEYEEMIAINPMNKLHLDFRSEKLLPRIISSYDLCLFFKQLYLELDMAMSAYQIHMAKRNLAVMELLMATGLRISEVCNIKKEAINVRENYIRVYGKGAKERILQIENVEVLEALKEYDKIRGDSTSPYFFSNRLGKKLSEQSVRTMIYRITKIVEIEQHITPHMFRHSFATMLLEDDVDIRYIQKILGHSSITTTQIYTHVTSTKQREILRDKNPRRRIEI